MKIIYDSALKEKLLAEDKVIMESVIPKMVAFKSVMGIRGIQYAKAEEMKKATDGAKNKTRVGSTHGPMPFSEGW